MTRLRFVRSASVPSFLWALVALGSGLSASAVTAQEAAAAPGAPMPSETSGAPAPSPSGAESTPPPLPAVPPAAPPAPASPPPAPFPAGAPNAPQVVMADGRHRITAPVLEGTYEGQVLRVDGSRAVVDIGTVHGAMVGMNVVIYADEVGDLGEGTRGRSRVRAAIAEIVRIADRRSEVELGFGEIVAPGMHARLTTAPTSSRIIAPARQADMIELSLAGTLFAVRNDVGFGGLLSGHFAYHGKRQYYLQASLLESGAAYRNDEHDGSTAYSTGGLLSAGFDHRFFSLGVGIGIVRTLRATITDSSDYPAPTTTKTYSARPGFAYAIEGRAGTLDGLHARLSVGFADYHGSFELGYLDVALQAPIAPGFMLVAHGGTGFGVMGYSQFDLSAKVLLRGNGRSGTLFVVPGIGWAQLSLGSTQYIWDDASDESPNTYGHAAGPSVRVGLEYRL